VNKAKAQVTAFLRRYRMWPADIDIDAGCEILLEEMRRGLSGEASSLEMLSTYIDAAGQLPVDEPVIAVDAGGTNFRAALYRFSREGGAVVAGQVRRQMPGIEKEVGRDEFFQRLAEYVGELAKESERIGFCFSYPCEIFPDKDGRLIRFCKEIKAPEVVGEMVGSNFAAALKAVTGAGDKKVVLLNDTVATLLAGKAGAKDKEYDGFIGFILGTGTNCCYIERNSNIVKQKDLEPGKRQIVNMESGGFAKAPGGIIDEQFDAATSNPGMHTFEKMVSGAYLGPLCLEVIKSAAADGLFSAVVNKAVEKVAGLETRELNELVSYSSGDEGALAGVLARGGQEDREKVRLIVEKLIERAAKLASINLSAAVIKSGGGSSPEKPVCIVAEGTTFYRLGGLRENVERFLTEYLQDDKKRYFEMIRVKDAALTGAAIAGLSN